MKFNVGDLVHYVGPEKQFHGIYFRIIQQKRSLLCGFTGFYEVNRLYNESWLGIFDGSDLRLMGMQQQTPLPQPQHMANQIAAAKSLPDGSMYGIMGGLSQWISREEAQNLFPEKSIECDCGGFKTYNSMAPENHSSWCSSRK